MNDLPKGWEVVELEQVGKIYTGKTPSTKEPDNFNGDILFVKPADLDNGGYIYETADYLSEKGLAQLPNLPKNAIMVTCIGNLGKVGITTQTCATNQQINSIIPNENLVNYKFLYYQILTLKNWLDENSSATTVSIINKSRFSKAPIILPPLAEQTQIATLLDNHLNQLDQIKEKLTNILPIIKQFRQSVLVQAVSGRLTNKNGVEMADDGYPQHWGCFGLLEIGKLERGKSKHRPRNDPQLFGNEYPFIQTGEVSNSNGYIYSATKFYSEFGLKQSKLFEVDTLCITIAANIADTAILKIQACFPDSIVGFTPNKEKCKVEFIKILIDVNKQNLEHFAPATAQKNINLKTLEALKLPLPPLSEQVQIVQQVEHYFTKADQLENHIKSALENINHMTQSLLHQAFIGNLTKEWRA